MLYRESEVIAHLVLAITAVISCDDRYLPLSWSPPSIRTGGASQGCPSA